MQHITQRLFCSLLVLLLLPAMAYAQTGTITGTVSDAETGETLPGANVVIEEANIGSTTNADGEFTLTSVPTGTQVLRATFVGYAAQEQTVNVQTGETVTQNFSLQADLRGLDEIVVTGLGIQQQRGTQQTSVARVDASEIAEQGSFSDPSQLISGNVAGVSASPSSGNLGSGVRFQIRGGGGLGSDGQPVIYVDGTRIDNNEIGGFDAGGQGVSPLADLNPQDIESIEVVRGPAGAAIYGTDGSNGVVLITTKSGSFSEESRINLQYRGTFGSTDQPRGYSSDNFATAESANAIFTSGDFQQHNFSVSGGAPDISYFASVDNRSEAGIGPRNFMDRTTARTNFEVTPNEQVSLRANASYTLNELERPDNDNNVQGYLGNTLLLPVTYGFTDSLAINQMEDIQRIERFVGSLRGTYRPTEFMTITGSAGYDGSARRQDRTRPPGFFYAGIGTDGERNIYNRNNKQFNLDGQAELNYGLGDNIRATSLLGYQYTDITRRISEGTAQGFGSSQVSNAGAGADITALDEGLLNERTGAYFGQHQFVISDIYTVSGMVRREAASVLGDGSSAVWLPSVSAAVRMDQYDFMPDAITLFRPRVAYGETGELPSLLDTQPVRFQATASAFGSGAIINSVGDADLVPERIAEVEAGVDMEFLDRYSLEANVYRTAASNSIIDSPLASSTGFGFQSLPRNVGSVVSQGIELTAGLTPIVSEVATLDFNLTYSYQTNEVQDLGPDREEIFGGFNLNVLKPGLPRFTFYTFDVFGAQFDEDGNAIFGPGGLAIDASEERVAIGNPVPDHTGGIRVNLTLFNSLNIGAFGEYALGHQVYNSTQSFAANTGNYPLRLDLQEQLDELEPGTQEYRDTANQLAFTDPRFDSNFIEDADWFKLREVTARYNFTELIRGAGVDQLNNVAIGIGARNLWTSTKYSGPDPEVNFDGARGLIRGQDFLTLATPRQFYMNLTLGF